MTFSFVEYTDQLLARSFPRGIKHSFLVTLWNIVEDNKQCEDKNDLQGQV